MRIAIDANGDRLYNAARPFLRRFSVFGFERLIRCSADALKEASWLLIALPVLPILVPPKLTADGVVLFTGSIFTMQLHQIELVPGESVRVGRLIVTLIAVEGNVAQLHVEDPDNNNSWTDPVDFSDMDIEEPVLV